MSEAVLGKIANWVLFGDVLRVDRETRSEGKSVQRFDLQFHRSAFRELQRHYAKMEGIARYYCPSTKGVDSHLRMVWREIVRQFELLRPYPAKALLGGGHVGSSHPKDEEITIKVAVFDVLQSSLQTTESKGLGISDQFLRALTLLLLNQPEDRAVALRHAVNGRRHVTRAPKKRKK